MKSLVRGSKLYRTEAGQFYDICRFLMDKGPSTISGIALGANMNHYATVNNCNKMVNNGMISAETESGKRKYIVIKKGQDFISDFEKMDKLLKSYGLENGFAYTSRTRLVR